jgi:hypothetical protein
MADGKVQLRRRAWGRRRYWIATFGLLAVVAAITSGVALYRAEPILRSSIIQTLSARFKSKVELDAFHVSLLKGFQVSGEGLRIFGDADPNNHEPGFQPIIEVGKFQFAMKLRDFVRVPMHVSTVYVSGLRINLPPKEQRAEMDRMRSQGGKIRIVVDTIVCENAQLIINTLRPGKLPLEFDIASLKMARIGEGKPLRFQATLTNPKPTGKIFSDGFFGPWREDNPRETPVMGSYSFTHADLSTIKGLGGILSSTGAYDGVLEKIRVNGSTDTPDFRLAICKRPVPLHTDFRAIVDGTTGDTYLQPVTAKILSSVLIARGSVVKQKYPTGHRVRLDITVERGKIDDLLKLAVKSDPPILTGDVQLKTKFDLAPGDADLADRIRLDGNFLVYEADFTDDKIQDKINALSLRSQGKAKLAKAAAPEHATLSELNGNFSLADGTISFSPLEFRVPGAEVALTGKYNMDGSQFDFHGTARTTAKLSHMVTGWKALLLKPVDPFFSKHGAGTELPVKISGSKSEPHFALDFGHKGESKRGTRKEETKTEQALETN